ncbi:MAG: hypothetical protein C4326_05585 [Ignavibacteria bacterium]
MLIALSPAHFFFERGRGDSRLFEGANNIKHLVERSGRKGRASPSDAKILKLVSCLKKRLLNQDTLDRLINYAALCERNMEKAQRERLHREDRQFRHRAWLRMNNLSHQVSNKSLGRNDEKKPVELASMEPGRYSARASG